MKELSIEQKAKAYDEALEVLKEKFADKEVCGLDKSVLQKLFPQLKESEDERTWIINYLSNRILNSTIIAEKENLKKAVAWLEKQGKNNMGISEATKQKLEDSLNKALEKETPESWNKFLDEQDELDKESEDEKIRQFLIHEVAETSDKVMSYRNMNKKAVLAWLKKQSKQKSIDNLSPQKAMDIAVAKCFDEQKPADKVEPKFKVGDEIIRSSISSCPVHSSIDDTICKVVEIHDTCYILDTKEGKIQEPFEWQDYYELVERKSTDKIVPKFKVGDFIVNDYCFGKVIALTNDAYLLDTGQGIPFSCEHNAHLWTIQDAKDGDVLATEPIEGYYYPFVAIYKKQNEEDFDSYCFIGFDGKFYEADTGHSTEEIHPATKEQRDLLFKKMKEAGYIWDSENKKLKGEEVDNIHNYLYGEQSSAWSEEDEARFKSCIKILQPSDEYDTINTKWLKSLKERVQPQDTAYYNPYKEVVESIAEMCKHYDKASHSGLRDFYDNVKVKCKDAKEYDSLYPQTTWKPSDEQIEILQYLCENSLHPNKKVMPTLKSLYQDLKKLREE